MVLVLIGTQKQDFSRIFQKIEESEELRKEEIIAQVGHTKYESKYMKCIPFMSYDEMIKTIAKADYIICHGGVGTIFDCLYQKKKMIVMPRLKKYGEHVNDHQIEICKKLEEKGYLLYLRENEDMNEKFKQLKECNLKEYKTNQDFLDILRKEI